MFDGEIQPAPALADGKRPFFSSPLVLAGGVIALITVIQFPGRILPVFAPSLADALGSQTALGFLFSVTAWGGLLGGILGGIFADHLNSWKVFRVSLLLSCLFFILTGVIPSAGFLYPAFFGASVFMSAATLASMALLPKIIPGSPRRILSLNLAISSGSGIALPAAAGGLLAVSQSRETMTPLSMLCLTYLVIGLLPLAGVWLVKTRPDKPEPSNPGERKPTIASLPWKGIIIASILGGLHGGVDTTLYNWAPTFYTKAFSNRIFEPAWILSFYALSYLAGRTLLSLLPEGKWERSLLIFPGLAGAGLLFAGFLTHSYILSAGLYILASLFYGLEYPALLGVVARLTPKNIGTVSAAGMAACTIVSGVLSIVVGHISDRTGDPRSAMLLLPAGFVMFSAIAWAWLGRRPNGVQQEKTPRPN